MAYFLCVLGMVFVIEAVPYMLFPKQVKIMARYLEKLPEAQMRIIGLIALLSGFLLVYLGRT